MSGACRVLLVGMMGSGKSTIGRLLSEVTGWPYLDNDELVSRSHGTTARGLLADRGPGAMRAAESDALALGLEIPSPAIVGVAAGVVLDEHDRHALDAGGIVVWLRASAAVLAERAAGAEHRPWLQDDPVAWMTAALAEREPLYGAVADVTIETDALAPHEAAAELRSWLATTPECGAMLR